MQSLHITGDNGNHGNSDVCLCARIMRHVFGMYLHPEIEGEVCLDLLGRPVSKGLCMCGCVPNAEALPLTNLLRHGAHLQSVPRHVTNDAPNDCTA